MNNDRYRIGKIHISATNPLKVKQTISNYLKAGVGGYVCVSNMRMIRHAGDDKDYAQLMEESLMNLPDGKPLIWLGKLWGIKDIATTNGPMLFAALMDNPVSEQKHYLLGDTEDIIERIKEQSKANIVGAEALPFTDVASFDYEGISKRIKASGANLVWTAMRAPKQDEFNKILSKLLDGVLLFGVGRAFRLYVKEIKDAPQWAQKVGIAGIFTRRKSLAFTICWYFCSFFYLIRVAFNILFSRLSGKKSYN
jgi:Teichoic acid biosynthesis proteins